MQSDFGYKDNLSFNVWLELIGGNKGLRVEATLFACGYRLL